MRVILVRMTSFPPLPPKPVGPNRLLPELLFVLRFSRLTYRLLRETNLRLALVLVTLTIAAGALPAVTAWIGALIVDAVIYASTTGSGDAAPVFRLVVLEGLVIAALALVSRGLWFTNSLLRAQLGHRVNVMILEKALTLELSQFEDSEFNDRLIRARRDASMRPLSLVMRTFGLAQNIISLVSFGILLAGYSPWAVALLLVAGLPGFIAETKFSADAYRLYHWRSTEQRRQDYLESVMGRDDHAKEVKLFKLGPRLLARYNSTFRLLYSEDRRLAFRRESWGFALGQLATISLYAAYIWVALSSVRGEISVGQMTMYLLLFRQGQVAVTAALSSVGGLYEDSLYVSMLYEYLDAPVHLRNGSAKQGPNPTDGIRFEQVSFRYPGASEDVLQELNLHVEPGSCLALVGSNGSGKTTIIKLLTGLYQPTAGRVLIDGLDLREWDQTKLRERVGVIFQDFNRYQLQVGENIGAGDEQHFNDSGRWREAASKGGAEAFIDQLPKGFDTQLGKWFADGHELSGGQWQKVALSRAFMRTHADILVLDEPTAAMDAQAEAEVFEHFNQLAKSRITILISHRFSTVRMANQIAVIDAGRLVELGGHAELMNLDGRYARLFRLQARGYE